jgi:hypothetical protein
MNQLSSHRVARVKNKSEAHINVSKSIIFLNTLKFYTQYSRRHDILSYTVMKTATFWVVTPSRPSDVSIIRAIALIMEAAITSATSANLYQSTRRNNPEDSHLHTPRRENLRSHFIITTVTANYYY